MILGTSGGDLGTFCSGLGMQNHSVVDPSIQNYIRLILSLFVSTRMLLGWSPIRNAFCTSLMCTSCASLDWRTVTSRQSVLKLGQRWACAQ